LRVDRPPGISDFILGFKLIYIYILNLRMVEAVLFGLLGWASEINLILYDIIA
jgi:hypothetical protein